ncbi:uroporphyrinogen-III synthase [Corynebacterium phocae]|uniref:uroporphyrinogen-III synthase n=1 Tax=Corynebacterium phocae TaxID=161895 RepID=UPI001B803F53|nr:uroporphyrinogen-III synthase [Corynebacterium phocae]
MSTSAPQIPEQLGKVIFVGAGPGNPDMLTIRAREVLAHNAIAVTDPEVLKGVRDMVACALPVPEELLEQAEREYEEIVAAAKAAGARRKPPRPPAPTAAVIQDPEEDLVGQLRAALESGGDVVRLVCGNPLNRESIKAEIAAVAAAGMEFQVVPGMSLPSTVPSFAGLALGSTYTSAEITADTDWDALAAATLPLVLQAVREQLPVISAELVARGMPADTEAFVTVHGTTRLQRTYETNLGTLGKLGAELPGDLVVTLGRTFDDRTKYSWWENRPLYGWRVLVPRTKEQAGAMSARLAGYGAIPQSVPTISVEPPRNPAQMDRAIKGIVEGRYKWIVFTSVNAVEAVFEKIFKLGLDARDFAGVHLAAVGTKTADALRAQGMKPELMPEPHRQNSQGLVEAFPNFVEDIDAVSGVLLPRADIAGESLPAGLSRLGWEVDDVVAYRTVRAAPPSAEVRDMIKSGGFDAVAFTSASTVRNLVGIAGKPHTRTIIACIGPATRAAAEELGLRVDTVPEVADVPSLIDALAEHVAALRAAGNLPAPRKKRRARKKTTKVE